MDGSEEMSVLLSSTGMHAVIHERDGSDPRAACAAQVLADNKVQMNAPGSPAVNDASLIKGKAPLGSRQSVQKTALGECQINQ